MSLEVPHLIELRNNKENSSNSYRDIKIQKQIMCILKCEFGGAQIELCLSSIYSCVSL